jgi:hypothetical protein
LRFNALTVGKNTQWVRIPIYNQIIVVLLTLLKEKDHNQGERWRGVLFLTAASLDLDNAVSPLITYRSPLGLTLPNIREDGNLLREPEIYG